MIKIIVCILLIIIFVFSGCMATPEKPVVINKGDNKLQEVIDATPVPTGEGENTNERIRSINGSHWTETYNITNLECNIDAKITLPDTNTFPVYKVAKRKLDYATADRIIKYFTAGATGVRVTSPTKEELEQELIITKRGIYIEDDSGGRWEPYNGQEQDIINLEEKIENAEPETFSPIESLPLSLPVKYTYSMADGSRVYIIATDNDFSFGTDNSTILQPESWIIGGDAVPGEPAGTTLVNVKIAENEAREKAYAVILALGVKNMGIAQAEKARLVNNYTTETETEGWCITFARNDGDSIPLDINGLQLTGMLGYESDDFTERWYPEIITVFVDDMGVRSFYWENPLEIAKEMNSNVSLLSFENIKERIKKNIEYGYSQRVQNGLILGPIKIDVNKVVLANVLVPVKDDLDHQMLQPAWLIYYIGSFEVNGRVYEDRTVVFAVNAIDGSSIDLSMRSRG